MPGDNLLDEAMGLAWRLARLMETALAEERNSMHSPEHVAIVAKLIATSS